MYDFITKWTSIPQLQESLDMAVNLYVDQFKKDFQRLILKIFNDVDFYDAYAFKVMVDQHKVKLLSSINEKTKIVSLIRDNNIHNSDVFLSCLNGELEISKIINVNDNFISEINNGMELIIVDDYSGSLTSLKNFLDNLHEKISHHPLFDKKEKINIIFAPIFITNFALDKFSEIKDNYNLFAISLDHFREVRPAQYIRSGVHLSEIEQQIFNDFSVFLNVKKEYIYGYKDIEDIIIFNHFVPNNTLGCLWWNKNYYYSIFNRYHGFEEFNNYSILSKEKQEFFQSLICKINSPYPLFAILILCGFNKITIQKIMKITPSKYDSLLRKSIQKGIIVRVDGKYIKSYRINEYICYERLDSYLNLGIMLKPEDKISYSLIKAK